MKTPRRQLAGFAFLLSLVLSLFPFFGVAASLDGPGDRVQTSESIRSGDAGLEGPANQTVRVLVREVTGPGDSMVRLYGENLGRVEMLLFNGLSAVFRTLSDHEILAWLPSGRVNGPIQMRVGTELITADPSLNLNIPGGLLLSIPLVSQGALTPVFTNAVAASDAVHWVLDNDGAIWVKGGQNAARPTFTPLKRTAELDAMKWIALTPDIMPPNERWFTLRSDGVLVSRSGQIVKHDRPIVSFAVGAAGIAALDIDGAVWNLQWPDQDVLQKVQVSGFGDPPTGVRQVIAIRSNRAYHYALNRAGQVFRWSHVSATAQRLTDEFGVEGDLDVVDWTPQDRASSGVGTGITRDGKLLVPQKNLTILGDIAAENGLTPEGFQQYLIDEAGRSYFLTRSGLAIGSEPFRLGLNAVGVYEGSVARIYSGFMLSRPRPYLGRGLAPLLSQSGFQSIEIQAQGHGPLSYEWQRNGITIEGETNAKLSPGAFGATLNQIRNGDVLSVRVSNEFGSRVAVQPPEITEPPSISSIVPTAGAPGTWVTLHGNHFTEATGVWFQNQSSVFRVINDNQIEARVPEGALRGAIQVYAHQLKSASSIQFNPVVDGSTLMVWPVNSANGPHVNAPAQRTDVINTFAGFGFSGARHTNGVLEVWGTLIGHRELPETTAIASLRSLPVYVALRGGRPELVPDKDGFVDRTFLPPALNGIVRLVGARAGFIALQSNNRVVAWPRSALSNVPAELSQGSSVLDITAGDSFAAALLRDGTIRVWGESQGPVPVVPISLPRITKIRAGGSVLYALDGQGNVWGLQAPSTEGSSPRSQLPLPWSMRDCVDIETGSLGLVALRRDGRWVTSNLNSGVTPANLESIEPTACFSLGDTHGLGLFQRSIYFPSQSPSQPFLAIQNGPFTLKVDVTASPYRQSYWIHTRDGIASQVAEGETLSLPAVNLETQGQYTLVVRNAYGVTRQQTYTVFGMEQPGLAIHGISRLDSSPILRVTSPYIAYFPFTPGVDPRWRFESAPTLDGPWSPVEYESLTFQNSVAEVRCKPSENGTGFFRIQYESGHAP